MMYRNMIPFRDPGSLAILESMLWENCRFYVVYITWRGSRDHPAYLAYHNAYKYPYRINTLTILPLLWMRILPVESISFLPKCEHLYLCDGKGGDDVGWEILEPISLPQGAIVTYYNDAILSGPRSMDILVSMFWRNPRFKISGLLWSGNEQDGNEFRKLGEYYNRRRRIRLVVSCVLTFLNAKILPGDLVRGELVPFLTQ